MAVLPFNLTNLGVLINDNDAIRRRETQIAYVTGLKRQMCFYIIWSSSG